VNFVYYVCRHLLAWQVNCLIENSDKNVSVKYSTDLGASEICLGIQNYRKYLSVV
jgi:hypothetical protein